MTSRHIGNPGDNVMLCRFEPYSALVNFIPDVTHIVSISYNLSANFAGFS